MVYALRSNAQGATGHGNEDVFIDPQLKERNEGADNNRTYPHSVNAGDQSPQRTHIEGSANTIHN